MPITANIIVDTFIKGGPIMWPVFFSFLAALAVVLERSGWWFLLKLRCDSKRRDQVFQALQSGNFAEAHNLSADPRDPFLATLHAGIKNAHNSLLGAMQLAATSEIKKAGKRNWLLGTFITLAPLLGLLGTVVGIMHSFSFIGSEELAASKVSGGIGEALIATAAGLCIAILSLIPFNLLNRKLEDYREELETAINHAELLIQAAKTHGHDLEEFSRRQALRSFSTAPSPHEQARGNLSTAANSVL